jgi:hypothetical protein
MPDIFISYAHEDLERVRPIVKELEERGWRVFWDKKIPAGQQWHLYIAKALTASHCVIVVWSRHSILSDSVIEEAQIAKTKGLLVPLRLDSVELPLGFGLIQAPDLSEWKNNTHDSEFLQLMDVVASKIPFSPQPVIAQPPLSELVEVSAQGVTTTPKKSSVLKPKPQPEKDEKITLLSKIVDALIYPLIYLRYSKKRWFLLVFILIPFVAMVFMSKKQEIVLPPRVEAVKAKPQADAQQKALKLKTGQDATASREAALLKKTAPKIGEEYGGGIVFYVDAAGHRGLVATKADLPGNYSWEAAKNACRNLDENGYSDWDLPGKDELSKLYQAESAVGGFASGVYWSSTEYVADYAWIQHFVNGYQIFSSKYYEWRVRPVRAFTY